MNTRKCDRCGKFYEPYNTETNSGVNGISYCRRDFTNTFHRGCIDLCPDCMNDVKAFLKTDTKNFVAAFNKSERTK